MELVGRADIEPLGVAPLFVKMGCPVSVVSGLLDSADPPNILGDLKVSAPDGWASTDTDILCESVTLLVWKLHSDLQRMCSFIENIFSKFSILDTLCKSRTSRMQHLCIVQSRTAKVKPER
jgi:hypothetical protein